MHFFKEIFNRQNYILFRVLASGFSQSILKISQIFASVFLLVICQTRKTEFDYISKHREVS